MTEIKKMMLKTLTCSFLDIGDFNVCMTRYIGIELECMFEKTLFFTLFDREQTFYSNRPTTYTDTEPRQAEKGDQRGL